MNGWIDGYTVVQEADLSRVTSSEGHDSVLDVRKYLPGGMEDWWIRAGGEPRGHPYLALMPALSF